MSLVTDAAVSLGHNFLGVHGAIINLLSMACLQLHHFTGFVRAVPGRH
jgi:hypothetical protein